MKCLYHRADLDGKCSAAIVVSKFPDCELVGIDYGDDEDFWNTLEAGETVVVVDFCLQPFSGMEKLHKTQNLVWIDHHKSAIEEYEKSGLELKGLRNIGKAGCALSWEYFYGTELPRAVFLIDRFDVWDHEADPDTLVFQYGMQIQDTDPKSEIWSELLLGPESNKLIDSICGLGKPILEYVDSSNAGIAKSLSFYMEFEGLKCLCANHSGKGSKVFDSIWDPSVYDAMLIFTWKGEGWSLSMYSDKEGIDVSGIAKKYGGGGHAGAAGFEVEELPFELKKAEELTMKEALVGSRTSERSLSSIY